MEDDKDIQNYIDKLDENRFNLVYNIPTEQLIPHIIQFKQLIAYLNFKIFLKEKLSNPNTKKGTLKEMYLIDKEWIKKWKIYIGYKNIKTFYNLYKTKNKVLNMNDYDWIEPVINNNCQKFLSPLKNKKIYDNRNVLNSEFIIVDKECYSLFSLNFIKEQNKLNIVKNYEVKIYFGKLILIISESIYLLKFKVKDLNCNFELLIIFDRKYNIREKFLEEIANYDINDWIIEINFDLLSKEQMELKGFTIMNRTLILKKRKSMNFEINDIMKEIEKLPINMMQSVAINQKNLENQFLLKTRAGKSFENEMNLIKNFNNNKLEKPNIETINNRRNNRKDNRYLSEAQVDLNKPKKNISPININNFNEYFVNNQKDINNNNNIQPQPQNQNIINIQINNFNNFSNNIPNNNQNLIKMNRESITINKIEYYIIKELGKGGFGRVKQVLSSKDNKFYAIKEIPIKEDTKEQIQSFHNEINILSQFNCNNIVKYYDSYQDNNNFYIIMEYCDGENLKSFIDKHRNNSTLINENILKNIIRQMCIGIKEIHNKKTIHRDLKPENIFMNENMEIKIGDFGISKQLNSYKTHTLTVNKAGFNYYIAPKIIYKGIYIEKSDLWSLGCIIYELFTLSIYSEDKSFDEIKKIDADVYNCKWQELIDSLLQGNYYKRFDINQVNKFLKENFNIIVNK